MTPQESAAAIVHRMTVHPKTGALLGYITGQTFTDPFITSHAVTSDGFVMVSTNLDPLMNDLFGAIEDLQEKIDEVTDFANDHGILTDDEREALVAAFSTKFSR